MKPGLFEASARCLALADPEEKCSAVSALAGAVERGDFTWDADVPVEPIIAPGRPSKPDLVEPSLHAIAHIEFNAINLALDAVYRFRGMPRQYYLDWISVAQDEARHFLLLKSRLMQMSCQYGDFPAHNGLWEMAEKTADSCLVRMALVPRVLEARGLDVTPGMIERLRSVGDVATIAALDVILAEEVRHVAVGTHWFNFCCEQENRPPTETFLELLQSRFSGSIRGPFNLEARAKAGFTAAEMEALMAGIG